MQLISCHNGQLQTLTRGEGDALTSTTTAGKRPSSFATGLEAIDGLLARRAFARGAVHEILSDPNECTPMLFALILARAAAALHRKAIVWCDPERQLYPPAVAAAGVSLDRLYLLHPTTARDWAWAVAESLRCKGVGATVAAAPAGLGRIEARRLQLAAETGGGAGILMRPQRGSSVYAAATRWLVAPARGERTVQRWTIQLIHGHGGRVGQIILLENHRETHLVRAIEELADRPLATPTTARQRASA